MVAEDVADDIWAAMNRTLDMQLGAGVDRDVITAGIVLHWKRLGGMEPKPD